MGDTFLFSKGSNVLSRLTLGRGNDGGDGARPGMPLADAFCVTHEIPYHAVLVGAGEEAETSARLLATLRNPLT